MRILFFLFLVTSPIFADKGGGKPELVFLDDYEPNDVCRLHMMTYLADHTSQMGPAYVGLPRPWISNQKEFQETQFLENFRYILDRAPDIEWLSTTAAQIARDGASRKIALCILSKGCRIYEQNGKAVWVRLPELRLVVPDRVGVPRMGVRRKQVARDPKITIEREPQTATFRSQKRERQEFPAVEAPHLLMVKRPGDSTEAMERWISNYWLAALEYHIHTTMSRWHAVVEEGMPLSEFASQRKTLEKLFLNIAYCHLIFRINRMFLTKRMESSSVTVKVGQAYSWSELKNRDPEGFKIAQELGWTQDDLFEQAWEEFEKIEKIARQADY